MSREPIEDALGRQLRAGDPAAGEPGLDAVARAAMRRRLLAAGRERWRRPTGWLLPATAAMALLALGLVLAQRQPAATPPAADPGRPGPALAGAIGGTGGTGGQQIQFTTDSGTLVVWVLQPRATG